jgi:hypothetical protein
MDDNGNLLVDLEDPACCSSVSGALLSLKKARSSPASPRASSSN